MRQFLFAISFLFLGLGGARAQEILKLDDLTREAMRRNPEILAAQKEYEAMRQRPAQESSLPDPMLSFSYNSSGSPRPFAGIGTEPTANAGLMLSQEFPFPGKRKLRGDMAAREADAEFQQYQMTQLEVLTRVKQAYHKLHHAYAMTDLLERNRDLLRKMLRITEARYSVGKTVQQDIFKTQAQLSILEIRIQKTEQEKRSTEAEINTLVSRPLETPMGRPEEQEPGQLTVTLQELLATARESAPMLRRDQKMVERTELALNMARKEYYPDYTVSAGYYNMGRMPDMYMARLDIKLPTWFWRKQRAGVAEQAANLGQARQNYQAANQTLAFRIKDDFLMADTSYRLLNMYATTVIPQSALALQSSLASYETGAVDFMSVLSNFMASVEYEMSYHEEVLSFHLALLRLEAMTGIELGK